MPEQWTGALVGLMHDNRILHGELAAKLGFSEQYVSMVLKGKRCPPGAEQRFTEAVHELIELCTEK